MSTIALIDYGMGNLASVHRGLERAGASVVLTSDPTEVAAADGVVLPGVGAFGPAVADLRRSGVEVPLRDGIAEGKPFVGICLGLQVLFEASEEAPGAEGLGVFPGVVKRFPPGSHVPHMGWNEVSVVGETPMLEGIEDGDFFYFVHSFFVAPEDPGIVATKTDYQIDFVSAICSGNLFACQFHPEKSQRKGLRVLTNFVRLADQWAEAAR